MNIAQPPCPKTKRQENTIPAQRRPAKKLSKKSRSNAAAQNTHTALGALMRIVILQTPVVKYNQGFRMMVAVGRPYGRIISLRAARAHR
ncbi:hypothetical protein ACFQI9_06045 [Paraburkholderia dipogonis]|uniref:hypothetical protein n=1 Tax=Paraburkholderia dipogonis TaxID=1211383 RepID=UPI00360A80DE